MEPWRITSDAPGSLAEWPGWGVDSVWVWPVERDGNTRTISVGVANDCAHADDVADESRQALETLGRSAAAALLERDEPPHQITITSTGIRDEAD